MHSLNDLLEDMRRNVTVNIVPGGESEWLRESCGLGYKNPYKTHFNEFENLLMISETEIEYTEPLVYEWARLRLREWIRKYSENKDFEKTEFEKTATCIEAAMLLRMGKEKEYVMNHLMLVCGFEIYLDANNPSDKKKEDLFHNCIVIGEIMINKFK